MKKWEYLIVDAKNVDGGNLFKGKTLDDVQDYMNELGKNGWEIINIQFRENSLSRMDFSGVAKRELNY